jgi:hypothetical protein
MHVVNSPGQIVAGVMEMENKDQNPALENQKSLKRLMKKQRLAEAELMRQKIAQSVDNQDINTKLLIEALKDNHVNIF